MYSRILVALENSRADRTLLPHICELARRLGSELLLVHVADGWAARNYHALQLNESEEMVHDRRYLDETAAHVRAEGINVNTRLALGDPPSEILKTADEERCDLIAMTTHGHRLIGDVLFGSTITAVRHRATVPLLLVRAQ
jgi:nucleotide-binding universal stress UspA family protein